MSVKEALSRVRKAIAVAVAGVAVVLLGKLGVIVDMPTAEFLISSAITAAVVYFVPNSKGYLDE